MLRSWGIRAASATAVAVVVALLASSSTLVVAEGLGNERLYEVFSKAHIEATIFEWQHVAASSGSSSPSLLTPAAVESLAAHLERSWSTLAQSHAPSQSAPGTPTGLLSRVEDTEGGQSPRYHEEQPLWLPLLAGEGKPDTREGFEGVETRMGYTRGTFEGPAEQGRRLLRGGKEWVSYDSPGFLDAEFAGRRRRTEECDPPLGGEEDFLEIDSVWMNVSLTFVCVVCAGLAAGLTMGLVSIEPLEMAIKQRSGTDEEKKQASRILPLVSRHHFLLVTLLLFNSLANEALPIFLGNLVPSWLAVILSVSLVLFFGEILPSAVFTGKGQLAIAAGMAWFVYGLMMVLGPVAWPLSWMLDRVLGIEGFKRYNRAEIAALVEVQQELSTDDVANLPLHPDEVAIVNGVLQTAEKSVSEAMITMDKVFCLSRDEKLDANTMADIMAAGYSRVLVYEGADTRNIRGYLQVKKMIILNPEDGRRIDSLMLRIPVVVSPTKSLLELLNTFQTGRSHLALISQSPGITLENLKCGVRLEGAARPIGIITLEDIIEEIIQEEIMDESDRLNQFIENRAKDTLLRFTRKRQARRLKARYATLSNGLTPRGGKHRHRSVNGSAPPSPANATFEDGGGSGMVSPTLSADSRHAVSVALPTPRGGERLFNSSVRSTSSARSNSSRRLGGKGKNRVASTTVAESLMSAVRTAREVSDVSNASVSSAWSLLGTRGGKPMSLGASRQETAGLLGNAASGGGGGGTGNGGGNAYGGAGNRTSMTFNQSDFEHGGDSGSFSIHSHEFNEDNHT